MKNVLIFAAFLYSNFFIAQSLLVPPENVVMAFEKQYPNKKPIWTLELGKNDEIKFVAEFKATPQIKEFVIYDSNGVFKVDKKQISISKLSLKGQTYLKKNYTLKAISQILAVVDDQNQATFIAEVKKDKKMYNVVLNKDGEFIKRIEIHLI